MSGLPLPGGMPVDPSMLADPPVGPVSADRIALVRRRLAIGRYPVDAQTLAAELLRSWPGSMTDLSHRACSFLAQAIGKLEPALAMTLQLLYCEQLGPSGSAAVLGWPPAQIDAARQAALIRLTMLLEEEASRLTLPRAASR